jgi:hypothetical protein
MTAELRRAKPYKYIVSHRPDYVVRPLPTYSQWHEALGKEQIYVCNKCYAPPYKLGHRPCAHDFFFAMRRSMLLTMMSVLHTYTHCQSRAFNTMLGLDWSRTTSEAAFPWYWNSAGIMYVAIVRHGVTLGNFPFKSGLPTGSHGNCAVDREC